MLPAQIGLGPLHLSVFGIFAAMTFVMTSFWLWKELREDYPEEEIITFTIWLVILGLIGARFFYALENLAQFRFDLAKWVLFVRYPGFSVTGGLVTIAGFVWFWTHAKKWSYWLVVDHLSKVTLGALLLAGTGLALVRDNLPGGETGLGIMGIRIIFWSLLLGLAIFLSRHYRQFIWYKSGKTGFVACTVFFFFFFISFLLDLLGGKMLYLDLIGEITMAVLAPVLLYRRSERVWREDLAAILKIHRLTVRDEK